MRVEYSYDLTGHDYAKGRLGMVKYQSETALFDYDKLGREINSSKTILGTSYEVKRSYDALNRLKEVEYPSLKKIFYQYNQAGQIVSIYDTGAMLLASKINGDSLSAGEAGELEFRGHVPNS